MNELTYGGESRPLPMVVWLQGDEEFFNDFSIDADEVMQTLGIKRSRLTQISGKELRVGRKRIERYIKPFYREIDIREYAEWVRPTATHEKSSKILHEAAHELAEKSAQVTTQLNAFKDDIDLQIINFRDNIEFSIQTQFATAEQLRTKKNNLHNKNFNEQITQKLAELWENKEEQKCEIDKINEKFSEQNQIQKNFESTFVELLGMLQYQQKNFILLSEEIKNIHIGITEIKNQLANYKEKLAKRSKNPKTNLVSCKVHAKSRPRFDKLAGRKNFGLQNSDHSFIE